MNWAEAEQEKKNSIPVALCVVCGYFGYFMQYTNITGQWALSNFACGIVVLLLSFFARTKGFKYCTTANRTHYLFLVFIAAIYVWSYVFKASDYNILYFLFYVVLPAYVISGGFRINIVLKVLGFISIPSVLFYNKIFALSYVGLNQASMGITYFVLDLVTAFILYLIYYREEAKWYTYISYIASIVLLIGVILHGVRGVILSLAVVLVFCYINKVSVRGEENDILQDDNNRKVRIGLIGLIIILVVTNYAVIFEAIYEFASNTFSSVPGFITKMAIYIRTGNILNGRDNILSGTFSLISRHPIFGVGVGNFGKYFTSLFGSQVSYPHNYILQFWSECGIISAIIVTLVPAVAIKRLLFIKKDEKDYIVALIFFVSLIFPRFFVSLNIWSFSEIWIALYCLINLSRRSQAVKENGDPQ